MRALTALSFVVGLLVSGPAFADKSADASYKEGLAYKQEGKTDDAIKSFQDAVAHNPKHGMAWASLGNVYKQKKATEKSKDDEKKDLEKSIDAYEHATQLITKDAVLWTNLGTAYANPMINRLDDALKALTTACHLDPKNGEIRAYLGTVDRKKGDNAGAIANLEIAVKLKADNAEWQHNLGVAYRFAKRDDDAIAALEKAVSLDNNDAQFQFDLAVAYRRKAAKDPDLISKAIEHYDRGTTLDPSNAEGWFDLGFMYKQDHQNDKAIDAFKHYLDLNKGKDAEAEKRINDECASIGGDCGKDSKKPSPKKPATPKK